MTDLRAAGHKVTEIPYKRPPITEAVIEIRFTAQTDPKVLADVSKKFKARYPKDELVKKINVEFASSPQQGETAKAEVAELGHKRSTPDQTQLLVLWPSSFIVSHLAPYPGWDTFSERFRRDWSIWKKQVGYKKIARIGVRFINRIDIPETGPTTKYEEFLNVYPHLPDVLSLTTGYALQAAFFLQEINCKLTLNSAVVPSPLLNHASFVFDQDIAREVEPPQGDDEILGLLNEIRVKKNWIFEACITDRARELFRR